MKTNRDELYAHITTTLWGYMKLKNFSVEKLAHMTDMGRQTFYIRLGKPENFRLKELIELADYMGMTVGELIGG